MKTPRITFFAHGEPQGQPRTKASSQGGFVRCYTPLTVKDKTTGKRKEHPAVTWKRQVEKAFLAATPTGFVPFTQPVKLTLLFAMPRPKSHLRANGSIKPNAPNYCPKKPDFDNLAKAVADQLTNSGAWLDDSQVCLNITSKRYADIGTPTGCHVTIEVLPE